MKKLKELCTKENLFKVLMLFLVLQPILDTYVLFDEKTINLFGISPSTVIRLIFIFIIGFIFIFVIKSKRQWLIYAIYILFVLIYSALHLYSATKFTSVSPNGFNYAYKEEIFYIIRMLIPIFILVVSANIKVSTGSMNRLINVFWVLITLVIVCTNILKISVGAYATKLTIIFLIGL